jgi:hypothetical protein
VSQVCRRHGTTTPVAAPDVKLGLVEHCMPRHRTRGFLTSPPRIDRAIRKPRPGPFVWTKSAGHIFDGERRALDALDDIRGNRWQATSPQHQMPCSSSFPTQDAHVFGEGSVVVVAQAWNPPRLRKQMAAVGAIFRRNMATVQWELLTPRLQYSVRAARMTGL